MDLLFGNSESTFDAPDIFYLARYLDLPIVDTDLRSFDAYKANSIANPPYPLELQPVPISRPLCEFLSSSGLTISEVTRVDPSEYPLMWASTPVDTEVATKQLVFASEVVSPILSVIPLCLKDKFDCVTPELCSSIRDDELVTLLGQLSYWHSILDRYDQHRSGGGRGHLVWKDSSTTIMMSTRLCAITHLPGLSGPRVFSYEQFLGWKDAVYVRMNIRLACLNLYQTSPQVYRLIRQSISWQEICLARYGNQGYELAKSTESLSKTYINRLSGGVQLGEDDAYAAAQAKHRKKERKIRMEQGLDSDMPWCCDLYHQSVLSKTLDIQTVVEIFGCQKAVSHPLINVYESGLSAAQEARTPDMTSLFDAIELRATWRRIFTEGYIKVHREWPILLNTQPGTRLHDLYTRGVLSYHRTSTPLSDWNLVSFGKMFDFDYYPNFLDVADDKAIAVKVSEKASAWDKDLVVESERRLLLEILRRPVIDHRAIYDMIEQDNIDPELLCVVVTPKEREFKLQARMFAMLNLDIRNAATIGEANLAHTILKYVQQLTMADDKLTVHQRFLDMTRVLPSKDIIRLFIELDLARWNLRWRALCIDMIGQDMNDLFGMLRAYTWIHKFFADCMVYVRSGTNRPDGIEQMYPPESDLLWYNHLGGFEGLAQKLWSIATVAMISRAVDDLPISYTMTAQGDNVVLAITTPRDYTISEAQQVKDLRDLVLQRCSDFSATVNQDLKPEECVDSTTTVTYSKAVYVNGVDYPTSIKALSRLFPTASVDFPSPESFLRSIFAGSLAAAEQARSGLACYSTGLWSAALASQFMNRSCGPYTADVRHSKLGSDPTRTRWFLTLPAEIGGYTVNGFYQYLYRGSGDPVSKSMASWYLLQDYYPPACTIIARLIDPTAYVKKPDIETLIKDPYSLPIRRPTTPEDAVAEDTLSVIRTHTKNVAIAEALACTTPEYKKDLLRAISSMSPFNPVIAHDLYDSSVLGTQEMIAKMFITTRSIQMLSKRSGGLPITQTLTQAAREGLHTHVQLQASLKHSQPIKYTLYSLVSAARMRWKSTGVNLEDITAYLPCDFPTSVNLTKFSNEIVLHARLPSTDPHYTRGHERAYLGTRTREKRADHGYRIVGKSYAASAVTTLQRIYSWSNQEEDVRNLIDHLTQTRIGIAISQYSQVLPTVVGGSAAHRFASRLGGQSAHIMGQSTFASHCVFDSDHAGYISATKDDYPLMFQELFLFMLSLADIHCSSISSLEFCEVHLELGSRPLKAIGGDRFSCNIELVPSLPYDSLPSLIQDKTVQLLRVSGLVPSSLPSPVEAPADSLKFQALCSIISGGIGSHMSTMGVLDHVVTRITLPIGILELAGMTMSTYLDACAVSALDLINSAIHSKKTSERRNAGVSYLVLRYARVMLSPILPLLRHPLLSTDETVVQLGLGDTPSYVGASISESTLISAIGSRIHSYSRRPGSCYHSVPLACFASDTLGAYGHIVLSAVRRASSYLVATNQASSVEASYFVGSSVLAYRKNRSQGVEVMLETLHLHLSEYSILPPRARMVNEVIRSTAYNIATSQGRFKILKSRLSDEEVVRLYREDVITRTTRIERVSFPTVEIYPLTVASIKEIRTATIQDMYVEKWKLHLYRNTGVLAPFGSAAYVTWQILGSLLKAPLVLIIGAGLGGAAAVACSSGADYVHGLDLRSDLPNVARSDTYVPPLVRISGLSHIYTEVAEAFHTSGDWFDDTVASKVLRRYGPGSVIVVDLSTDRGCTPDVVKPLVKFSRANRHLVRCVAPSYIHAVLLAYCYAHFPIQSVFQMSSGGGLHERVYLLGPVRTHYLKVGYMMTVSSGMLDLTPTDLTPVMRIRPGISTVHLTLNINVAMLTAYLGGATGPTVRGSLIAALTMFSDLITTATSRPAYEEWTRTLGDAAQCDWLLHVPIDQRYEVLQSSISVGLYQMRSQPTVFVLMNPTLIHSFVTQACRLIGHLNARLPTYV